jgi:hypothetical protein
MKSVTELGYKLDAVDKKIIYMLMDNAKTLWLKFLKTLVFLPPQYTKN